MDRTGVDTEVGLLPVCTRHHTRIHDAGWRVTLGADRSLTVHLPDGQVLATGPPGRRQRAA